MGTNMSRENVEGRASKSDSDSDISAPARHGNSEGAMLAGPAGVHEPYVPAVPFLYGANNRVTRPTVPLDPSQYHARDDWREQSIDRIHAAAAQNHGVLFSITPKDCCVCMEKTIEMFPCKGAHHYCISCRRQEQTADDEQCPCCRQQYIPSMYAEQDGGSSTGQDPGWYDQLFYWYHNPKVLQLAKVDPNNHAEAMAQLNTHDQEMARHIRQLTKDGTNFELLQGLSDTILKPNDISSGEGADKLCYCADAAGEENCPCTLVTHHDEWRWSCHLVQVCEENSQQFHCPDKSDATEGGIKVRRLNANLRRKLRVEKALQAERELKECLRTNNVRFAASQDQAVELCFNEMRNAIYSWLKYYNDLFRHLGPADTEELNRKLVLGIIHPMEHTILSPHEGMPGGAMRNYANMLTKETSEHPDIGAVDWEPIRVQMAKDLKAGNSSWRQDGKKDYGKMWWLNHGCDKKLWQGGLGKMADAVRAGRLTQAEADERMKNIVNVWTATSRDPLATLKLYEEECDAVEKLVAEMDVDTPEMRAAAGFGKGPAVIIDLLRKRREFFMEAEGMVPDGSRRWVNASFKELNHPDYQNTFPELVLHLGEVKEGKVVWRIIRRENLSSWTMPAGMGDDEDGAEQVPLNIHPLASAGQAPN